MHNFHTHTCTLQPLFAQVQLHPSLVTDSFGYELSKAKWGSMEPHDIATLSLQLCLDTSVEERGKKKKSYFGDVGVHIILH